MTNRLAGKVVVVTGAARGMGAAHARAMAREGAAIVLSDVLDDLGEAVATSIRADGGRATFTRADVTSADDWQRVFRIATEEYGTLTTLVNNAGIIGSMLGAADETEEAWYRTIAVNQTGVFLGMKYAIPLMRSAGGGSIVNICSIWGVSGVGDYLSYQASKGAVRMMTRSAAIGHAAEKIRVNNVCPGMIMTEMAIEEGEENNAALIALTPMGRGAEPSEVSGAIVFLASDESSFVTGTEIAVDGGYLAQ
ncbi:glucose 1-dehydrogenase [Mycolicibacterium sediminis]|uniref:glucose 1-dehydrogenase n=1 Tax=Mycolicibacterium sediminis TaxID=1286180 RepID=UPI001FE4F563|nr:glucose 1-dehydrogenase [Mycolicibacterium sediminis]